MDFFSRINPTYKSVANRVQAYAQPATSRISGLLGSLLSRVTPAYKNVDGHSANAPASSSGIFSMFSTSPSYQTARMEPVESADTDAVFFADADTGDAGVDEGSTCIVGADQIVVL